MTDADKIVSLAGIPVGSFCAGTNANWTYEAGSGSTPVDNNIYNSGYTLVTPPPEDCKHLYSSGSTKLQQQLCSDPLAAIINNCPYNGGQVKNACGSWWLQSCPFEEKCAIGNPSGG
jgi:hypothetical protein